MKNQISSKPEIIQTVYNNYADRKYLVNRQYQRKLVWSIEEKEAIIDSIQKLYSIPLFLFATNRSNDDIQYEIIDGMQRLDAICSFIENEFAINYQGRYCYFDLDALVTTKEKVDKGELKQRHPKLPREVCSVLANYELPCSYIIAEREEIEEIFRRINSFGKQLSSQEIRQAGALGEFPRLVRTIAESIRGDVSSSDMLVLNSMKSISLNNKRLRYGIDIQDIFWVKEGIITHSNMRLSRDEEEIAFLLCMCPKSGTSKILR